MNPELKTCKTCKYDVNGGRDEGFYCDIDKKPETFLDRDTGESRPLTLMRNCPYWESKRNKET
jgi:hypothetical protein